MLNKITIAGRITADLELNQTTTGTPVTSFTVAVDRDIKSKYGTREADFIPCVAWRNAAEFISKYFAKGDMIILSGRLQSRKWQDKDGNNRTSYEVVIDNAYFGGKKNQDTTRDPAGFQEVDDDPADLPF